ncbi:YhcN/YlaJ family sporulation lipoprotein [Ammoniphilus resinae]|uniref:Sporulation protein n=1 Tax=Ammoniphilus resinae TaxID=861532 RepID=A0ABS4GTI7_9BACL|nr:YhcN/YlaJ family sporulation lipoprotein [Ammoniphilus resinae]MBP1933590.1 hypothetical protein [Ammoniphilus resinae]
MKIKITGFALLFVILTACQSSPQQTKQEPAHTSAKTLSTKQNNLYNPRLSKQAEQTAKKIKGVDEAVSVVLDKDISIAVKVTGFDRFKLKSIKKELHEKIRREADKKYTIHITTDKKIYKELSDLRSKLKAGSIAPEEQKKKFEKLNKDMHG